MKGKLWLQITVTLVLIAGAAGGLWALVKSLDPGTLKMIVGFLLALATIVVVGALYAGKDLFQSYLIRRRELEDQAHDTQRLAQWTRLMSSGSAANRVNFHMPNAGDVPALMPPEFSGAYRDTTTRVDAKVEIE